MPLLGAKKTGAAVAASSATKAKPAITAPSKRLGALRFGGAVVLLLLLLLLVAGRLLGLAAGGRLRLRGRLVRRAHIQTKKEFQEENPDTKGKELTAIMAAKWEQLDDGDKKKYESKAKLAKIEYDKAFKKWQDDNPDRVAEIEREKEEKKQKRASENGKAKPKKASKKKKREESEAESEDTESDDERPAKKKAKKDPNQPKRPISGYLRFCGEKREAVKQENPELKAKEIMTMLGQKWKALSDEEKAPYNKAYEEAKAAYDKLVKEEGDESVASEEENDEGAAAKKKKKAQMNGNGHANGNGSAKSKPTRKAAEAASRKVAAAEEADGAADDAETKADADADADGAKDEGEAANGKDEKADADGANGNGEAAEEAEGAKDE